MLPRITKITDGPFNPFNPLFDISFQSKTVYHLPENL